MTRRRYTIPILLLLSFVAVCGCGGRGAQREPSAETPSSAAPTSHQITGSKMTMTDPNGRWTLDVRAERVKAAGVEGPYELAPAECTYQQAGRRPVFMRGTRAGLDKKAEKLVLEGNVHITSGAWQLEADRVEYDLNAGEVVAPGRTKWSFDPEQMAGAQSSIAGEGEER